MRLSTHVMFQGEAGTAASAASHYASAIEGATREPGAHPGTEVVRVAGHEVILFDSPVEHAFDLTPSVSLFLVVDDAAQVDGVVDALVAGGGSVLMPVGEYEFSPRFGWCVDRFGVSWQVSAA